MQAGASEADSCRLKHRGAGGGEPGLRTRDPAAETEQAEAMEGDGVPSGSELESGPGPGGGGVIRELCRALVATAATWGGQQNLRDNAEVLPRPQGLAAGGCPSSCGGREAARGPAGDVAATGLPAGKEGER